MTRGGGGGERRRAADVVGVLAVLLALVGAVALVVGLRAQQPAPPQVPAAQDASTEASGEPRDSAAPDRSGGAASDRRRDRAPATEPEAEAAAEQLGYSRPVDLRIPAIGVDSRLVDLGIDESGAMDTPEPEQFAGWFTPSPPPGIPGSTVIAGHVSWDEQPSVFFRLGDLRRGDRVEVRRADGVRTVFAVTRLGTFPKDEFPREQVFDQPAQSELRLITCGGEFDAAGGRHLSNVIVWARMVDVVST